MKILVVGLGLIGGSYAASLSNKGHKVYGVDINNESLDYALNKKWIVSGARDAGYFISDMDMIIICLYPKLNLEFLVKYSKYFKEGQIITDVCGVKSSFVEEATKLAYPATYLSHHPMAGKEKVGIKYSDSRIFIGANFLITPFSDNDQAIEVLKKMAIEMGFGRITVMSPKRHDQMIGFTSQLTHAIAVSLVNSDHDNETKNFIGDSYRDLTRIAMINESLWSELFLENKEALLTHIESFENELNVLKNALYEDDKDRLNELFRSSTKIRKEMEK